MPELLLELLSEEIPARMQARAAEDLKKLVCDGLKAAGLAFTAAEAYATPRRLALMVDGIPATQPDVNEERRGPRADAPDNAIQGFKRSLPKGAKVELRDTEKGRFHFAQINKKGGATKSVLPGVVDAALVKLPWPKSMRWADYKVRWVRPAQGAVCLFAGKPVAVAFGPVKAGDATTGHRFLAPKAFKVKGFADYKKKLKAAKVILDPADRRDKIQSDAEKLANKAGLNLKRDPGLLAEVAGLVEWPVVRLGAIDAAFMELPPELLTTVMRHHQKYFALADSKGKLAPRFAVVLNTETRDDGKAAVAGNERVLRARLSDARFFWDQDRKRKLESRVGELGGRVFHAKLGTVWDKVERITALAETLARHCKAEPADAVRAATLAKADLSTGMVGEFPELQGVIGRYYALHDGEKPAIADAVAEHYSPQGPGDDCPSKPVSVAVALADKIDTLVGFWSIGEKPTGSRDPFALRRAALGVIRLIVENGLRLPLGQAFAAAKAGFAGVQGGLDATDLMAFVADRLKVHLRDKGVRHDLIDAVFSLGGEDDLVRLLARVDALGAFLKSADGANLHVAYKRAANIVRIEEKKDGKRYDGAYDHNLLSQDEERTLATFLAAATDGAQVALKNENFTAAMAALARLRRPVDGFFDHVTVNCDDARLRENRLRLLAGIGATLDKVADFSKLEGGDR